MVTPLNANGPGGTKSHNLFLLLKDAIASGSLGPGSKIPGELKLAQEHNVSRVTVRRALQGLTDEGLIMRKPGVGTLVCDNPVGATVITASVSTLLPNMKKMGESSRVRLLEFSYGNPSEEIRNRLLLQAGDRTQRSVRVRSVEDKPFSYLTTHVPEQLALSYNEDELAKMPLFALLERSGVQLDHATQSISATLATREVADALGAAVGSALISLTRVVYDKSGQGVEHLHALYRPDRYRIEVDLCRAGSEDERYWQPLVADQK
ncbi:GntR family transcriptional regulator [Granulosicoccus antarcticus]|uniref:HTH-type transcriptional repressor YvoA n=1 Tax=Granulosicoccus antarcticus IMCC3135 TaxID=1192854 RepID=A0A2Z2NR25_9GAMM|nr:GntR family transcriptional regulator [Granulosicoccus antarcticus]ASJ73936.1 HTH-type transcriptional repressor YvoA [Granulosicoccus antarcticus IMCC3135]